MALDPALLPLHRRGHAPPPGLAVPAIAPTADTLLDHRLAQRLACAPDGQRQFGRLQDLALQLARIQNGPDHAFDTLTLTAPQLLVFAADHGIADQVQGPDDHRRTQARVLALLAGAAPTSALARLHGVAVTVVDAGLATPVTPPARSPVGWQARKIGFGTRNLLLGPAMSVAQASAALQAGMDVVRQTPGNVVAVAGVGEASSACAGLLLSRLCGVPVADACARAPREAARFDEADDTERLDALTNAALRHRALHNATDVLAAMGGFDLAMMAGAMLQAASERRIVLVDGFAAGAAALVARALSPAVTDYLVFSHRAPDPGHRLMLIHLQADPLLDLGLTAHQGTGALLAWPLVRAAQALLDL